MTVRSRCPVGLLRRPVRSVKLQGTSFPEGARSPLGGAHCLGGRIPLSRERRRSGASPLGGAPCPSYSERNRSHTVLRGADRRHPVGGPAARAALSSSPVGPSPSKSREPWLVLSLPDRLNRTRPAAWARTAGLPPTAPTAGPRYVPTSAVTTASTTAMTTASTTSGTTTTAAGTAVGTAAVEVTAARAATARAGLPTDVPPDEPTRNPPRPRAASRAGGRSASRPTPPRRPGRPERPARPGRPTPRHRRSQGSPPRGATVLRASRALCAASPVGAASPAVTAQGLASGVAGPRPTPRGLR